MIRKLLITKSKDKILTTILENDEVVELHCMCSNEDENAIRLGNIYIGKVKNIVKNIGAAFIEVASGVECYYALEDNESPIFTNKIGKKPLCIGDELVVQVSKEAVKTKVPTVTSKLSFTGKYAVLTAEDTRIGVSNKLGKADRTRLLELTKSYTNDKFGYIIRTNAKDASDAELAKEMEHLANSYRTLADAAQTRTCFSCLKRAPKQYLTELRNIYQEGLTDIIVEEPSLYEEIKTYLESEQPEDLGKLRLYTDELLPLHKLYSLDTHVANALKEKVWLKSGAYLVIQHTEALTVIDVNTGKCVSKKNDEDAYLKINIEAAKEAAKQIRLRNLSGIILVDFINLSDGEKTEELLHVFRQELQKDPIITTLVDMTKLQLVEVTRKKVRKPFFEAIR